MSGLGSSFMPRLGMSSYSISNAIVAFTLVKVVRISKSVLLCVILFVVNLLVFAVLDSAPEKILMRGVIGAIATTAYYGVIQKMEDTGDYGALFWVVVGVGAVLLGFV